MKNKGFTLIELLAILVILAVIALIGTPIISNVIKNAKASALVESARNILDAAQLDYDEAKLNETDHTNASNLKYKGTQYDDLYINYGTDLKIAIYDNGTCVYGTKTSMMTTDAASASECYDKTKNYVTVNTVSEALAYTGSSFLIYEGTDSITNSSTTPTTTPQTGDTLICGQYEYRYNQYYKLGSLTNQTLNGWSMVVTSGSKQDATINTHMLVKINGQDVVCMNSTFYGGYWFQSIDLSSFDTSKVTDMYFMFYDCELLTSLDLSSFDTSKVTDMQAMFSTCTKLQSLNLNSLDTSKVTTMHSMFSNCSVLLNLDLSSFDTSKVTKMTGMFSGCSSLTSLDLSSFKTSLVTTMNSMFNNCTSLTSITGTTGKWVINTGTSTTNMFSGCGTSSVTLN